MDFAADVTFERHLAKMDVRNILAVNRQIIFTVRNINLADAYTAYYGCGRIKHFETFVKEEVSVETKTYAFLGIVQQELHIVGVRYIHDVAAAQMQHRDPRVTVVLKASRHRYFRLFATTVQNYYRCSEAQYHYDFR